MLWKTPIIARRIGIHTDYVGTTHFGSFQDWYDRHKKNSCRGTEIIPDTFLLSLLEDVFFLASCEFFPALLGWVRQLKRCQEMNAF